MLNQDLSVYVGSGAFQEVVSCFEAVIDRLDCIGVDVFFDKSDGGTGLMELEWFSDQAWNAAVMATKVRFPSPILCQNA